MTEDERRARIRTTKAPWMGRASPFAALQQVREHASESDDPTKNAENLLNHPSSI